MISILDLITPYCDYKPNSSKVNQNKEERNRCECTTLRQDEREQNRNKGK